MLLDGHKLLILFWPYSYVYMAFQSQDSPPSPIIIEANQTNATIGAGMTVILSCYFPKKVDCQWERRGTLVDISGRYSYQHNNGTNTQNCTLSIRSFQTIDDAQWVCQTLATSATTSATKATRVYLHVRNESKENRKLSTTQIPDTTTTTTAITTTTTAAAIGFRQSSSISSIVNQRIITMSPTERSDMSIVRSPTLPKTGSSALSDVHTTISIAGITGGVIIILILTIGIVCIYRYKIKQYTTDNYKAYPSFDTERPNLSTTSESNSGPRIHRTESSQRVSPPLVYRRAPQTIDLLPSMPSIHRTAALQVEAHSPTPLLDDMAINMESSGFNVISNRQNCWSSSEDAEGYMKPIKLDCSHIHNDKAMVSRRSHYSGIEDDRPDHFYHEIPEPVSNESRNSQTAL